MKYCPNCQTNYTDDTLQFCLQDGTPLADFHTQATVTDFDTDSETLVSPKQVEPIRFEPSSSYPTSWEQSQPVIIQPVAKKSNTTAIVLLTALGTILLLGIGGIGAWLYFNSKKTEVAANVNIAPPNRPTNSNVASNQTTNANLATASPSATPTPQPTLNTQQTKAITDDVKDVVDDWKSATEDGDLDGHLSQYADTVDYYKGGRVGIGKVRADKQRALGAYDSININITNLKITPDASGEKATALFDKEWNFEGENKYSAGKVQQQLLLSKINGRWLITSEKDLKVYYVE